MLNRYTLQKRIEGSNPSVSARTPGFESLLGRDAWKLIRVPFQDTAAGCRAWSSWRAGRSQEEFWRQSRYKVVTNSVLKLLKIRTYALLACSGQD